MRTALYTGVDRGVPTLVTALQLAEAWHVPPWEIMDHPGSLMWAARYMFYRRQANVVQDWQIERAKKEAKK